MILLDNNAGTPVFPEILEEVYSLIKSNPFLNPSSIHGAGKDAKKIMERAKAAIASSLNAKCHDIYFTSGASEANNMVLASMNFSKIFTIKTEHDSILSPILKYKTEFVETDACGILNLSSLEEKIKSSGGRGFLCSLSYINNESGVIQNMGDISKIVHEAGGLLHADCSQLIGKRKFDFAKEDIDIITFTGHKFHALPGSGCAIFRSGLDIKPLIEGGGQQNFKRAGTENIPAIFAISRALSIVNENDYIEKYIKKTYFFQEAIEKTVLSHGGSVFGRNASRASNTSLISMKNINNFIQLMEFDINDICVSIGAACSSGKTEVSHVLKACGILEQEARNYIRVSTSSLNENFEIEKFLDVWKELSLRAI